MTEEELRQQVNEIVKRTRNQTTVEYADVDILIAYIDFLEFKQRQYEKSINRIETELGIENRPK